MIQIVQFPWSPFCIVQRRILEYGRIPFKIKNIPNGDRTLVWKLTRGQYYAVPVLLDGKSVIFESGDDSQDISRHLDRKFKLGLFPAEWDGVQTVLSRHLEGEVEGYGFKLNDIYYQDFVAKSDMLGFVRHKERKFGRGCLLKWREQQAEMLAGLTAALLPYEQSLGHRPFLLGSAPLFVDFDLFGMLENFLFSGNYQLPSQYPSLAAWHQRMATIKIDSRA